MSKHLTTELKLKNRSVHKVSLKLEYENEIKDYPENLDYLELYCCSGNFENLPKTLKSLEILFWEEFKGKIILPEGLENLVFQNNSDKLMLLPKLPSTLKFLSCSNMILPKELPESLKILELKEGSEFVSYDLDIFKNIIKLKIYCKFDYFIENRVKSAEKLKELTMIMNSHIMSFKFPDSLIKLKVKTLGQSYLEQLDFNNITHLTIDNTSNDYFPIKPYIFKIKASNVSHLVLKGNFNLKKEDLVMPKLKTVIYSKNYRGNIILV